MTAPRTFAELRLFAHVELYGYAQSEVDTLRLLAERGCPRSFAAELMYRARSNGHSFRFIAAAACAQARLTGWLTGWPA